MKNFKNLSLIVVLVAFVFTGCKYEEGPGISFRSKTDRLANEWKVTGYEIDGQTNDSALKSFRSSGDSIELIFIITRNNNYAMNMAYTDGYNSPSGNAVLSPSSTDTRVYQDILMGFGVNNGFFKKLQQSGIWTFSDKYKVVSFGANGNGDLSHVEGDSSIIKADIIMLKNNMLKLEYQDQNKKHRITFEPKNKEIVK